jgi:DNA-binding LacI/PurR family transcriptional regulator
MSGIKEIAKIAGVSPRTVSRAIRGNGYVSDGNLRKIKEIAAKLKYVPNRNAQSLKYRRSNEISLLIWSVDEMNWMSELYLEKIAAIEKALRGFGHVLKIRFADCGGRIQEPPWNVIEELKRERPLGVIMFSLESLTLLKLCVLELEKADIPVTVIDAATNAPDICNVHIDKPSGVYQAVSHFAGIGRRRIAYIGPANSPARLDGFNRAIKDFGLSSQFLFVEQRGQEKNFETGHERAKEIVSLNVDAVQAYSDEYALGLLAGLRDLKVKVPDEVAVIGFDNRKSCLLSIPKLSSLAHPNQEAGESAAKMIADRIAGKNIPPGGWNVSLPLKLIIRGSA